jgi:hypothetical protein
MAALTETTANVTEFSGKIRACVVEVDPSTSTAGSVTIDEMSVVLAVFTTVKPTPTAIADAAMIIDTAAVHASVNSTTTNQIDLQLVEGDGTINTENPQDFYLLAIGY